MALHEVRVKGRYSDTLGLTIKKEVERTLGLSQVDKISTAKVYRLQGISKQQANALAKELLSDPLTEQWSLNQPADFSTPHVIEVAYKPGVMNPEVSSIIKAAHDQGIELEAADSSREYAFFGELDPATIEGIVSRLLVNKTVQHIVTTKPTSLTVVGRAGRVANVPILKASEAKLMELSRDKLFLNIEEMIVIQNYFRTLKRDPTDAELEIIAARWSEHCGHKTFNAKVIVDGVEKEPLYTRIKKAARQQFGDLVVSAFSDNSGVMRFYDGQTLCGKVETHNSPSAIEPYGGAMTGSGGVFRDIMGTGQGAKTVISTDMFCFAPPDTDPSTLPPGTHHPDYLQRRVVQGVRDYGNRMGIPTANGSVHYHKDFRAKPTVIVGAYGIMPEAKAGQGTPQIGDVVVIIGGRTGRDGIHGATFSSGEMTDRTAQVNSSAVQIGNAIEEKRTFDAILQARDQGLIRALTDCGAAGFSSAIGEMGEAVGVTVDISKAPLKYPGLAPWEIWLSESQERMVAAVPSDNLQSFLDICGTYNVEATALGTFDGSHTLTITHKKQLVAQLDYEFLTGGLPQRVMQAHWQRQDIPEKIPKPPHTSIEWVKRLKAVLAHGNVCSKEPIVRQYDHGVQGGVIVSPFGGADQSGPNDALVIRPMLDKPYGIVQSHGMNPVLNTIDPYQGTVWAIAEAAANYVAVGGNIAEAAAIGNYIWPYPDEEAMGSLDKSVDAATMMMGLLKLPVISGKDSLSSTYRGKDGLVIKIPPVYTMSIFGRIPDVAKTVTSDIKQPGNSTLWLVGTPSTGMAASTYYDVLGASSNTLPHIDTASLPRVLQKVHLAIEAGRVLACHDVSEGGLVVAVAEMCFGGQSGAHITIPTKHNPEHFLFAETAGCFIIEVDSSVDVQKLLGTIPIMSIGHTSSDGILSIEVVHETTTKKLLSAQIDSLKQAWQAPMRKMFQS